MSFYLCLSCILNVKHVYPALLFRVNCQTVCVLSKKDIVLLLLPTFVNQLVNLHVETILVKQRYAFV